MRSSEEHTLESIVTNYYASSYADCSSDSAPRDLNAQAYTTQLQPLHRTSTRISSSSTTSSTTLLPHPKRIRKSLWPYHVPSDHEKLPLSTPPTTKATARTSMRFFEGWSIILFGSWLNILIVFLPAAWIIHALIQNSETLVFISCIFAMIPLVRLHDLSTGELAVRLGGAKTGLLNSSMGNLIELVVATTALRNCQLRVVQASLIGSMLSKLLLVLGLCLFAGGLRFSEQHGFDPAASQIHSSLLSISVGALLIPAAYHFSLSSGTNVASVAQKEDILRMSHGVSIILLLVYTAYLAFHFFSHSYLFKDNEASTRHKTTNPLQTIRPMRSIRKFSISSRSVSPTEPPRLPSSTSLAENKRSGHGISLYASSSDVSIPLAATSTSLAGSRYSQNAAAVPSPVLESTVRLVHPPSSPVLAAELPHDTRHPYPEPEIDSESDRGGISDNQVHEQTYKQPRLSYPMTLLALVIAGVLVALNAERLVEALETMEDTNENISTEWIGLIVLPTVSVIAECITAVNVSRKDQLTLSVSVAVGSTIQTALFVIPLMVVFGWVLDKPLALLFDPFETVVLFLSVHTMSYVIADGKGNWLEGALLICLYVIIAVAFWFYPGSTFSTTLGVCAADD